MADMPQLGSKTVVDLAAELGVRSETVLRAARDLGLGENGLASEVDPDAESFLVEQLIDNGAVPSRVKPGGGRKPAGRAADDDLLLKALGAGEEGWSESKIPRQIQLESSFSKKPPWWKRLFQSKNELVKNLKSQKPTDRELNAYFSSAAAAAAAPPSGSPFLEEEDGAPDDDASRDWASETDAEPESVGENQADGDGGVMDELEKLDMEELDFEGLDEEGLEALDELEGLEDEDEMPGDADAGETEDGGGEYGDAEDGGDELEDAEDGLEDLESLTEGLEDEFAELEGEESGGGYGPHGEAEPLPDGDGEEQETPPGILERLVSRIQLTPAELWTLTGGSLLIMLMLLGVTVYWWLILSPKAQTDLWETALANYRDASNPGASPTPDDRIVNYEEAARGFLEYLDQFPGGPHTRDAFKFLCDSHRQTAKLHEEGGREQAAASAYEKTALYYGNYLDYLEERASDYLERISSIEDPDTARGAARAAIHLTFPDVNEQENALFNIAEARWKVGDRPAAVQRFKDYVRRFGDSERSHQARLNLGRIHREWAAANEDQSHALLGEAVNAYEDALRELPEDAHRERMATYRELGSIAKDLHAKALEDGKPDQARTHLVDAIGYLERAEEEARAAENLPLADRARVFADLGGLYLLRGREAGKQWMDREELAEIYPEGDNYKTVLEQGAENERRIAEENLTAAMRLYDDLLTREDELDPADRYEILYNKTDALRILRRYPEALETGEALAAELEANKPSELGGDDPHKMVRTKIFYLLGHIAWEMAEARDYSKVKEYYAKGLEEDGFFPKEENGETSHLAEIRLTNIYFMLDKKYEKAIQHYASAVDRFPDDGYSYLTFYWYAKALEEYGGELMRLAEAKEAQIRQQGASPALAEEARALREKAKDQYNQAIDQFGRAIGVREKSKYIDTRNQQFLIDIHFSRGNCAFKAERYVGPLGAETYLTDAMETFENHPAAQDYFPPAIERLGDLNAVMADHGRAARWYRRYLDRGFPDPEARVAMKLADAHRNQLSYGAAREWYRKIINDHPLPTRRQMERDRRLNRDDGPGPGYEAYKKLAQTHYDEAGSLFGEEREAKIREALDVYREFARRFPASESTPEIPADPDVQRIMGNLYYEIEDFPNAVANYERFLNQEPDFPRKGVLLRRIGDGYRQMGDLDQAIEALNLVTEGNSGTPEQYAGSVLALARTHQEKADIHKLRGEDIQYETQLRKASQAYGRAIQTGVPEAVQQATVQSIAINRILESLKDGTMAQAMAN